MPLEEIFNTLPKVRRSALVGLRGGQEPAIVIEPFPQYWPESTEQQQAFISELNELAQQNELTSGIRRFFFNRSFPVDARHNAKIFRDQLSDWADKVLATQRAA